MALISKSFAIRAGSLGTTTTLITLSSALAFPVLISQLGLSTWGELAFAQSLGLIIATIANWGYPAFGQKLVASLARDDQTRELAEAIKLRLVIVATLFALCCLFLYTLKQQNFAPLCACAGSYVISGISNIWYFQGTDATSRAIWHEALPKVSSLWIAISALWLSGSFAIFSFVFILCSVFCSIISTLSLLGLSTTALVVRTCFQAVSTIKKTWMGATASAVSLIYMAIPTVVIGVINPLALPTYALIDRLIRFSSLGLSPLTAAIQSWILLDQGETKTEITIRKSGFILLSYASAVGLGFLISLILLGIYFSDILKISPLVLIVLASVTLSVSVTTQILGTAFLGSRENLQYQFGAASAGAGMWLVSGPIAIFYFDGVGAQLALACAEFTVLLFQIARVASIRRDAVRMRGEREVE